MSQPILATIDRTSNESRGAAQSDQADHAFPMLGGANSMIPPNFRFMWAKR